MRKIKLNRKANGKYKMEYTNIEARLLNQLSKLNYILSKNKVLDLVELVGNTKKLLIRNFASGIIKGIGAGIGFAGLYLGGSVVGLSAAGITSGLAAAGGLIGGGMAAGIAVLAAPAVVLGGAGIGVASHIKNKKLREAKELIYKNALAKQNAILKALKEESNADKERIEYLNGLNILLQSAIKDLQHDLGIAA